MFDGRLANTAQAQWHDAKLWSWLWLWHNSDVGHCGALWFYFVCFLVDLAA
jgi:hypothetical protein